MTNEEMERAMQFILEQQAQFAANHQRHEGAMQKHDETIRRIGATQEVTAQQITHLSAAMVELAEAQERAETRAEAVAAETKVKIDILIDSQIKNEERFAALANAQAQTSAGLDSLRDTVERFIKERRYGNP